jgi:hypothetical protein
MRFKTKFDRWIVAALAVPVCLSLGLALLGGSSDSPPRALAFLPWLILAVVLSCMLPQYYDVRGDGLFIRQGWRRILIAYDDLVSLQTTTDSRSAGVFSTDRMLVTAGDGRTFIIAPNDQEGFLDAVAQRAPQLERKGFGLAVPFASMI